MDKNNETIGINDLGINFETTSVQFSDKSTKFYMYNSIQPSNPNEKKASIYIKNEHWKYNINSILTFPFEFPNIIDYVCNSYLTIL